jgi:hypothetical protein
MNVRFSGHDGPMIRRDLALFQFEANIRVCGGLAAALRPADVRTLPDSGVVAWLSDSKGIAGSITSFAQACRARPGAGLECRL